MAFKVKRPKEKKFEVRSYKVYKFENLPKDVQEKVLEKYRYFNVDDNSRFDYDDGIADSGLPNLNQKSYNESAGVKKGGMFFDYDRHIAFDLDRGNYLQFNNLVANDENAFRKVLGVSEKTWKKVSYKFVNDRERDTEIEFFEDEELSDKEREELENATEVFKEIMRKNKQSLKENYEYQTTDEAVKEGLIANDYYFNEKGEID